MLPSPLSSLLNSRPIYERALGIVSLLSFFCISIWILLFIPPVAFNLTTTSLRSDRRSFAFSSSFSFPFRIPFFLYSSTITVISSSFSGNENGSSTRLKISLIKALFLKLSIMCGEYKVRLLTSSNTKSRFSFSFFLFIFDPSFLVIYICKR